MTKFDLPEFAIFEDTLTNENNSYFYNPIAEIIAFDEKSLEQAFIDISKYQKQGLYLAGFISYEAIYYLNSKLKSLRLDIHDKLLHFVAFKDYSNKVPKLDDSNANIDLLIDDISFKDYQEKFAKTQQALINGDSYEINLTKNIYAKTQSSAKKLYTTLKEIQPVGYAAFLPFLNPDIISISPELFFKKERDKLIVRPMKGTAKLTGDSTIDKQIYNELKSCKKNLSENLIIVDLLRNDLYGIAKQHTVKVEKAFSIEKYKDILQMTSEISSEVDDNISFSEILNHLFPCGSITGAPKNRTIELIKNIENGSRGVYTGSIGYILPNNDMTFNVAIRTLQKNHENLQIGVGGGITVYSDVQSEWQEMLTKINFIKRIYKPKFSLVESLYFSGEFRNLALHLERLENTAERLFFKINIDNIVKKLNDYVKKISKNKEYKIRLEYFYNQEVVIEHIEVNNKNIKPVKLIFCRDRVNSKNSLLKYKTTDTSTRGFYTNIHNKYIGNENDVELVFLNEQGNITETRFHNIVVEIKGQKYTPLITDGVLDGVARKLLLESKQVIARSISMEELKSAEKIYLVNDVRGLISAYLEG